MSGCADSSPSNVKVHTNLDEPEKPTVILVSAYRPPSDREYSFEGNFTLYVHRSCTRDPITEASVLHESSHNVTNEDFERVGKGWRHAIEIGRPIIDRQGTYLVSVMARLSNGGFLDGDSIVTNTEHPTPCSM